MLLNSKGNIKLNFMEDRLSLLNRSKISKLQNYSYIMKKMVNCMTYNLYNNLQSFSKDFGEI